MDHQGSRTRRRLAGFAVSIFAAGFVAMLVAQLALMSLLSTDRAEEAAAEVASSAFVAGLIDDAVRNAVTPIAGPDIARQVGITAGNDPRVRDVVRSALVAAHRNVVDPATPRGPGTDTVNLVVADVVDDLGTQTGVDLSGLQQEVQVPDARPDRLPDVGLKNIATLTRLLGGIGAVVAAVVALAVHPRPARALSRLGAAAGTVCAGWMVALLVIGWAIGQVAETLFGELLDAIWSSAAPAMLGVVAAGALLGGGTWLGGRALEGMLLQQRRRPSVRM